MLKRRSLDDLAENWWSYALRGIAAIICGLLLIVLLGHDVDLLFRVLGGYMLLDGLMELGVTFGQARRHDPWWHTALSGLAGMLFGASNLFGHGLPPSERVYMVAGRTAIGGLSAVLATRGEAADRLSQQLVRTCGIAGMCLAPLLLLMRVELEVGTLVRVISGCILLLGAMQCWIAARLRRLHALVPKLA